ncbi:MAG: RDD family protein [Solirubrobacterales bacterium]|nr:RDD family protein [Solirubrobacterales bacterium]
MTAEPDMTKGPTQRAPEHWEEIDGELVEATEPVPVDRYRGGGPVDAAFVLAVRVVSPVARLGWRGARGASRRLGVDRAVGRAMDRALESDAAEKAADKVLGSPAADRVWTKVLESEEAQKLVERVAEAPEVRSAITSQGVGLLEDVRRSAREFARHLDDVADRSYRRLRRRPARTQRPLQAGAVSRLLAIGLDAAILNGILLLISTLLASLLSSVFGLGGDNQTVTIAFGAFAWFVASVVYLAAFWTLAERTPGMTFFGLRIRDPDGGHVPPPQDLRRLIGFYLSALPLFLGFRGILTRDDRRGFHDRFAGTVVLYADPEIDRGAVVEGHIRQARRSRQANAGS